MTRIKICGITNIKDAIEAAALGVEMLGFVFYKASKRRVDPALVRDIINELPEEIEKVGVFVDEQKANVIEIAENASLTTLQFHGSETPEYCSSFRDAYKVIKAFRINDKNDLKKINGYDTDYYLFDSFRADSAGGTGQAFDWTVLKDYEILRPFILAGGLDPGNVALAIKEVVPFGVDVSSGVELLPGKKNHALMKKFVDEVRRSQ